MALARKGTRKIVVSGTTFRWAVAPNDESGIGVVVELYEHPASRAVVWFAHGTTLTPSVVANEIRAALSNGWNPSRRGTGHVSTTPRELSERSLERVAGQCPCCDYFSLSRRGHYDICRVCFWEDSGQDLDRLDEYSGPNHMTLREARRNFLVLGACDQHALQHVLPAEERAGYGHRRREV